MKTKELEPGQKKITITIFVEEKTEPREVTVQNDGKFHNVCECLVGDETGCVYISLWDEKIQELEAGKHYEITDAYTTLFKHSLRLNLGKYATIKEKEADFSINTSNNMSLKEF